MYLTYIEYQNMGGTLDATTFNQLEFEAESIVNWYTFNRLRKMTEYTENVKRLMFKLISMMFLKSQALSLGNSLNDGVSGAITSQSNDGFSMSYNVLSASQALDVSDKEVERMVTHYLTYEVDSLGRKLLYRGLYADE